MGERTFQIGEINCDTSLKSSIINILDKGFKFIPNFNLNPIHVFYNIINTLEEEMFSLNKQFFFKKQNLNKSNKVFTIDKNDLINLNSSSNESSFFDENFTHSSLENFLDFKRKLNRKNNCNNISISKDCIFFQLELFKQLNNIRFNFISNLDIRELALLKKFVKEKPFKIVELDKNVGSGIISNELNEEITLNSLRDVNTYEQIFIDPLETCINEIKNKLTTLLQEKKISKKLYNSINISGKLGNYRNLPKIHKKIYGNRPIINYKNQFLNDLCYLLDFLIRPYVITSDSYIKDSQDFIQKTKNIKIPENYFLVTADFVSLYSNINHDDCLFMLTDFFKDKLSNFEHLSIEAFHSILKLVLNYNFFKYKDLFFKQIKGIAMGSICGPSIANIFVFLYEKKWLTIHRPLIYLRFIDDLFLIINNLIILESLKESFGDLELTFNIEKTVNYLDLEITRNDLTSLLDFSLFFKPTNTFSYLHISSNHPKYIFSNLIKSLFIRAKRICSKLIKFIYFGSVISDQLISRGYERNLIDKIFTMVSRLDRDSLLLYKKRKNINFENTFLLKNRYDNNVNNFKEIAYKAFDTFKEENVIFKDHKLMIVNTMQNNLSSILVHNFKYPYIKSSSFKHCENLDCKTCLFSNFNEKVFLTKNFILPIPCDSDCESKNVIYIIYCSFCNTFYIGQSKDIKKRIYKHLYDIKKFIPFNNNITSVSIHYNLKYHNFKNHFTFFIFKKDILNLDERLNRESFLINLCKKLGVKLMNDHIPFIKEYISSSKLLT